MSAPRASAALPVRVRRIDLFERPVTLRLPFRFGAATVTRCPQAFVRAEVEIGREIHVGASAELMVPKWFDKSPALTHEQNFDQLRESLRSARAAYTNVDSELTAYDLSHRAGEEAIRAVCALGLPRLAAQFGPALLDKAVADAALRAVGRSWLTGVPLGLLGDPWSATLVWAPAREVWVRHTVGLADRLTASDAGSDPADGLPATLQEAVNHYGLRYFKLKLCGRIDEDLDRLSRIAAVLDAAPDWRVTLDGNETFESTDALGAFWAALSRNAGARALLERTLLLEQPLPRSVALAASITPLRIDVPVILDESDDRPEVLEQGLALGYRGISTKACKGIYRSLHSASIVARDPRRLLLSGEDLTCQAGLAVQQDTLLAASLGVAHIERNGHHYVDGFGIAPDTEAQAFADAHPGFYDTAHGRPRLAVRDGRLDLRGLHATGFARAAEPLWDTLQPIP